jgi:hypothetical protein
MNPTTRTTLRLALAAAAGVACLFSSEQAFLTGPDDSLVMTAQARVGRPLTPVSYAGVARRTTARAVAVGAAVATPVVVAPVVVVPAPGCVQVVNAYGQIVYRCP